MTDFMQCPDLTDHDCEACNGTGRRGAKKNGKKQCRECMGTGKWNWCKKHDVPCPVDACKNVLH